MIFKERAVLHTATARNPLGSDPWRCSCSHQLYFSALSASLPRLAEPLYSQPPVPACTHLDPYKFTQPHGVLTLDVTEHLAMFFRSQRKSWARTMQIWGGGSAETVWLWCDDLVDRFEFFTVHMEEKRCLTFFLRVLIF